MVQGQPQPLFRVTPEAPPPAVQEGDAQQQVEAEGVPPPPKPLVLTGLNHSYFYHPLGAITPRSVPPPPRRGHRRLFDRSRTSPAPLTQPRAHRLIRRAEQRV